MGRGKGEAALIPCGTGDDFVRIFQDKAPFLAIERQLEGTAQPIDLMKVNGRYAANLCNLGIDAETAADVHRFSRFMPGPLAYSVALIWRLFHRLGIEMTVTLDDKERFTVHTFWLPLPMVKLTAVDTLPHRKQNMTTVGWRFVWLSLSVVFAFSRLLNQYKAGNHLDQEAFQSFLHYRRAKKAVFRTKNQHRFCV